MYIYDLPKLGLVSAVSKYADRTGISFQSKEISRLNIALNNDLSLMNTWMQSKKLYEKSVSTTKVVILAIFHFLGN